jgi:predicted nuclease with TOPRIM domain
MQYSDRQIREAQETLSQQEALVQRMIARGTPTQAAEDRLRQLEQTLSRMKEHHRRNRAFDVQRKIRDRRSR